MRYFTKEWYTDSLVAEMCFQLRKTDRAGVYSDKFYERLYAIEQRAYLKYCRRMARLEKRRFDAKASASEFDKNYEENLDFCQKNLPEEILSEVKDIRVLALGSATYEQATKITRYCGQVNRKCEAVEKKYDEENDGVVERMGGCISHLYSELIGAQIESLEIDGGSIVLSFSGGNTGSALQISLRDACVDLNDGDTVGATIQKYELLPSGEDKIEFSILATREDSSLCEVTLTANTIEIELV